jgi:Fic family protein
MQKAFEELKKYLQRKISEQSVSSKTTRKDLQDLVALGLMQEININQRQMGYIRSDSFEVKLERLRRNHKE